MAVDSTVEVFKVSKKDIEESFKKKFLEVCPTRVVHSIIHDDGSMEDIVEPNSGPDEGSYLLWIGHESGAEYGETWVYHFMGPSGFWEQSDEFLHGYLCAIMDQATWREIPDDIWGVDAVIVVKDSKLQSIRLLQRYTYMLYELVE